MKVMGIWLLPLNCHEVHSTYSVNTLDRVIIYVLDRVGQDSIFHILLIFWIALERERLREDWGKSEIALQFCTHGHRRIP